MYANKFIIEKLGPVVKKISGEEIEFDIQPSNNPENGDYSTSVALKLGSILKKKPLDVAYEIKKDFEKILSDFGQARMTGSGEGDQSMVIVDRVEVAPPGFVNFFLSKEYLLQTPDFVNKKAGKFGNSHKLENQKIMVEYAHPNTHKEMHIGHMRTLITGEALARLFESQGAKVFRANYQGDIGPHVAKALYGIQKIMREENLSIGKVENWNNIEKAHFLGRGYVRGNQDYESHKEEIDDLNSKLYSRDESVWPLYEKTRKWNLDYYEDFYKRFYTKFDHLFFESQMDEAGAYIVRNHVGKVFEAESNAIIFPGKKYGLHNRVFITSAGNPTYEGKEMANAEAEYKEFPFDRKIHVVASEQAGYFQVVFKALEMINPKRFSKKQYHVSMGMVQLANPSAGSLRQGSGQAGQARKMSSRTGDILTVDWLVDEVKERFRRTIESAKISKEISEDILEAVTIGAIKYSVLKQGTGQDVAFDINQSVSLDGNSGPYLQYTYVRTQSVLEKGKVSRVKGEELQSGIETREANNEELSVLRQLVYFPEIVSTAAQRMAPNLVAEYLFDLSQKFNFFYQKHKIADDPFRLELTRAVGQTLKNGLNLLGIETVERM